MPDMETANIATPAYEEPSCCDCSEKATTVCDRCLGEFCVDCVNDEGSCYSCCKQTGYTP